MIKEPMLSEKATLETLHLLPFPCLVSPKLDGIRAFVDGGKVYSRRLKLIPSTKVQTLLGHDDCHGLDGELIVGPPNAPDVYRQTSSGVMSRDKNPDFTYWVFDDFENYSIAFERRIALVQERVMHLKDRGCPVKHVHHELAHSVEELLAFEDKCLRAGYEGIMIRHRDGLYKQGRANWSDKWLFKLKRFVDFEAVIIGVHEKLHNDNPAEINEMGRTKRSGHQANKRLAGTLGGFELRMPDGIEFRAPMGKGWNDADKQKLWNQRDKLLGQTWVVYSLPYGVKDKPRMPKVKGPRND